MKALILITTVSLLMGCQTVRPGQCGYSVEPATYGTVTETVTTWGPPTRELITVPAVIDPVTGEVLVPARTEEPKEKYPMVLGEETRRIIKTPKQYSILDENGHPLKTLNGYEFESFQKKNDCVLISDLSAQ